MSTLENKVALVTGGTSGIGAASVRALAAAGAKVLFTGRRAGNGTELENELKEAGHTVSYFQADVAKAEDVSAMVAATVEQFGRLDIAFNNAGVEGDVGPFHEQSVDNYHFIMDINVRGLWLSMQEQIKVMLSQGGGSIINNSSVGGHIGFPGASIYVASKHAVMGLTRTAALEYAQAGIRINAVCPGGVATEMLDRFTGGAEENIAGLAAMHPMGRVGRPSEIADGVVYLASDASSFVTGQSLTLDGGMLAQ